jgi:hypothetical protein
MSPRWRERLRETETLSITNPLRGRIQRLGMGFKLYHPQLSAEDLATDRAQRRAQLRHEGERVERIMQGSLDRLRDRGVQTPREASGDGRGGKNDQLTA